MKSKKFLCTMLLSAPLLANATDITISNHTDSYGTGYINTLFRTCSATLGERGIMQPHQENFSVPGSVIKTFCGNKNCEAYIFKTQNCGGDKIAVVTLNANDGVVGIENVDKENYVFVGSGSHITIESPSKNIFKQWLSKFF